MLSDGSVDLASLEPLLDWHIASKTDNLCILGTTAEASLLSMSERKQVLDTVTAKVKGIIPFMVGTGTIDPTKVKDMTEQALDCGADASLVVTPYYIKPPQAGLVRHYLKAAEWGLPVVVYNVPGRTAVDMTDESIAIVAQHDNVVAVKDATGDVSRVASLGQALEEQGSSSSFLLLSGDDGSTVDFCAAGGHGCVSVTANIVPDVMRDVVGLAVGDGDSGSIEQARLMNRNLMPLHTNLFCQANPIPAKWCLHQMGKIATPTCREPLTELEEQHYEKLVGAMSMVGIKTTTTTPATAEGEEDTVART